MQNLKTGVFEGEGGVEVSVVLLSIVILLLVLWLFIVLLLLLLLLLPLLFIAFIALDAINILIPIDATVAGVSLRGILSAAR